MNEVTQPVRPDSDGLWINLECCVSLDFAEEI